MCRGFESHPSSSFFLFYKKIVVQVSCIALFIYVGLRVFIYVITTGGDIYTMHLHKVYTLIWKLYIKSAPMQCTGVLTYYKQLYKHANRSLPTLSFDCKVLHVGSEGT